MFFSGGGVPVPGGAGFIGSALVWALNRRGCERIVVCDRLGTDEKWRNLIPLRFADYVEADDLLDRQCARLGAEPPRLRTHRRLRPPWHGRKMAHPHTAALRRLRRGRRFAPTVAKRRIGQI